MYQVYEVTKLLNGNNVDTLNSGFIPKNKNTKINNKSTFRDKFSIAKNYFIAPIFCAFFLDLFLN